VKPVYKPDFFTSVYDKYGDGGILAIMAHEVGHAIDRAMPVAWMKTNWTPELRADAWLRARSPE
jgi:Zn-dependent protease with chaperone function